MRFIDAEEIRRLMQRNGLSETGCRLSEVPTQGPVYEGIYGNEVQPVSPPAAIGGQINHTMEA